MKDIFAYSSNDDGEDRVALLTHDGDSQGGVTSTEFVFAIEGMTCVACSGAIERLMHSQFDNRGMTKMAIVLLTHKMTATIECSE